MEFYLKEALGHFEKASNDDNLYRKLDSVSNGLVSLCHHLEEMEKSVLKEDEE